MKVIMVRRVQSILKVYLWICLGQGIVRESTLDRLSGRVSVGCVGNSMLRQEAKMIILLVIMEGDFVREYSSTAREEAHGPAPDSTRIVMPAMQGSKLVEV